MMTPYQEFSCQNNGMGAVYGNAIAHDFHNRETELLSEGYTKYHSRSFYGNLSASFRKGEQAVYLYFIRNTGELREIREPYTPVPAYPQGEKICTPRLIHFGFDFTDKLIPAGHTPLAKTAAGQSELLLLEDGSFVIIDGGIAVDNISDSADYLQVAMDKYATRLHGLLKKYNPRPDGAITVSAWIFTHLHRDHCTLFSHFAEKYGSAVVLKSILYNYPLANQMSHDTPSVQGKDPYLLMQSIAKKFKGEPTVLIPHTGQCFRLCEWMMEILITYEDAYPADPLCVSTNNCSMVFRLTPIKEQDRPAILFLGDAYAEESAQLLAFYGGALRTPVVQSAHHGYENGGTEELYRVIGATHVLWTHSHARWMPENQHKTGIVPNWLLQFAPGELYVYPQCNAEDQAVNWHLTFEGDCRIRAKELLQANDQI